MLALLLLSLVPGRKRRFIFNIIEAVTATVTVTVVFAATVAIATYLTDI